MRLIEYFFVFCGFISLFLGVIGIFLPLLPTTPFLILAAVCFSKGSKKFHLWLVSHRIFGPPIRDWQQNRIIETKYKIFATAMLLLSALTILSRPEVKIGVEVGLCVFFSILLVFIWIQRGNSK